MPNGLSWVAVIAALGVAGPGYAYSAVLVTRLIDGRWTEPELVPGFEDPRNMNLEPVSVYFTREERGGASAIWRSRWRKGRYQEPERLPAQVNSGTSQFNAFVSPDQSYVIAPLVGRTDTIGGCDCYVVFREPDDRWIEPINLGPTVNTAGSQEFSPYVSPDGKYFFFMSSRLTRPGRLTYERMREVRVRPGNGSPNTWWVEASVVTSLRARALCG